MKISKSEPGVIISAAVHIGLLAAILVAFAQEPKFEDAQEAIPVETITDAQFNQIMKGEKTAKAVTGKPRVDRLAKVEEAKPTPPTPDAKREVAAPPPALKHLDDPGQENTPEPPTPPQAAAPPPPTPPTPPVRPEPPKPEPPKVEPPKPAPAPKPVAKATPPEDKPDPEDAEPIKPPTRPKPPEKPAEKPTPAPPPKPVVKKPDTPKPKLDEVAKLLSEAKDAPDAKSKADKGEKSDRPAHRPKSGDESAAHLPAADPAAVSKLLSREAAQSTGATGKEVSKVASLGAPNASAAKMSPSLGAELNGLLQERYKQCWSYFALSNGPRYVPKIRIAYRPDGSLANEPVLTNPPSDPASRSLADSALRAVRQCDPLHIPPKFQPYYQQWKDWLVGFDPDTLN